jgi:membrane protease YdiL (CAAX protease family)
MNAMDALKRIGIMLGGMIALVIVVHGAQLVLHHRVPNWLEGILIVVLAIGVYVLYVRLTARRPVDELAPAALLPETVLGLLIGVVLFAAVIGLLIGTGKYHYLGYAAVPDIFAAFATVAPVAVIEELLFRGFLFRVVQSISGTWIGIAISALVFGGLHAINPHATVWSSLAIAIEAGALLAVAYAATRRLWLPIGIHLGWNFTQGSIFGVPVSGHPALPSIFRGVVQGPDILTGGAFGLEASLFSVLVCGVATVVLLMYTIRTGRLVAIPRTRS